MRALRRSFAVPAGWQAGVVAVPADSSLEADLRLEAVVDGVLVSGTATVTFTGECGRCLDPVEQPLTVDIQELFVYDAAGEEDLPLVEAETVNLEPTLRDSIILGLPANPLCEPDCAGLCPGCGERRADLPADHAHDEIDPRWAALAQLSGAASPPTETETEEK